MPNKLLDSQTQEVISNKANQLLANFTDISDQWSVILNILDQHKITLKEADLKDISGMLVKENSGNWVIIINKDDSKARKLFTIAHELGHYQLHKDQSDKFIDGQLVGQEVWNRDEGAKYAQQEIEANEFAANLIMPQRTIEFELREINKNQINEAFINNLAGKFGVSSLAMLTRLKNLGYVN